MSHVVRCNVCLATTPFDFARMKEWFVIKPAASQAFAALTAETHICPDCWEFLKDNRGA